MTAQWATILQELQKSLESGVFKVWIAPLEGRVEGSCVALRAPNHFVASWVRNRLSEAITGATARVMGIAPAQVRLEITHLPAPAVDAAVPAAPQVPLGECADNAAPFERVEVASFADDDSLLTASAATKPEPARRPLSASEALALDYPLLHGTMGNANPLGVVAAPAPHWRYRFDDYVVGPTNEVAVAAARDVCHQTSPIETLFLSAESGLGKTHLVQAMGQMLTDTKGSCSIAYLTAEEFTSRFVAALRARDMDGFKSRLRDVDVLMLEDVHFLQGKEKIQEEALTTIKSLQARGSRVVLTSSFSPRELRNVDSQLVSHFCSGFLTHIGKPTVEMRRSILTSKASLHQVMLPDSVKDLLAERICADVRQLESCLNNLIFKARHLKRQISLEMALEIVSQYAHVDPTLDVETIIRLVCESYGLNLRQISSRSRRQECVVARNTIYYLARKHTELSLQDIGEKFNRRHSTVIKGITNIEREIQRESSLGRQLRTTVTLIERNAGIGAR